ncbi:VOC family protein [Microbacterium invictum]|uniref:VOC family protein n=1 Tax=Microbacterium invictum TaxID=515415 RepID=A0ABZ0VAS7_9MICO|nr:VOC family protein [Microbacterium invictum]WQB70329.1 VOC family protein [Microbacterium invictum]
MTDDDGRTGTITPAAFHAATDVAQWRVTSTGPQAVWRSPSLRDTAALVGDILDAAERFGILPDIDLRPEAVVVRVPYRDLDGIPARCPAFAAAVSAAATQRGLVADPSLVQTVGVYVAQHSGVDSRPFFLAALGYDPLGDTDAVDPLRAGPPLAFNPITGDAPGRGRTHFDVFVPADQARARVDAALAAGGRLADDSYAPRWWSLASPDNHGVDIACWTDTFD